MSSNEYEGRAKLFSWTSIKQKSDRIFLNQANCTNELINKFVLGNTKISKTLMATTTQLYKDELDKNVDIKLYRSMIDSLLYLIASRSDIMLVFVYVLDFNLAPKSRI